MARTIECDTQYSFISHRRPVTIWGPGAIGPKGPLSLDKFEDPLYRCLGSGPYVTRPDLPPEWHEWQWLGKWDGRHLAYLSSVPPTAEARVTAMEANIAARSRGTQFVSELVVRSRLARQRMAELLYENYTVNLANLEAKIGRDAARQEAALVRKVVDAVGPDRLIDALLAKKTDVLKFASGIGLPELKQIGALLGPVVTAISNAVGDSTKALVGAFGSFSGAVPVIGAMIQATIGLIQAHMATNAARQEAARRYQLEQEVIPLMKQTMDAQFPVVWNLMDTTALPLAAWRFEEIAMSLMRQLRDMRCLSHDLRSELKRWWALVHLHMADDRVSHVFQRTEYALWASDEQVLQIAVPIAVAYGLPVHDFAVRLYNASGGWASEPAQLFSDIPSGSPSAGGTEDMLLQCGGTPTNANVVQYAVLARDAFKLAEAMTKPAVSGTQFRSLMSSMQARGVGVVASHATKPKPASISPVLPIAGGLLGAVFLPPPASFIALGAGALIALASSSSKPAKTPAECCAEVLLRSIASGQTTVAEAQAEVTKLDRAGCRADADSVRAAIRRVKEVDARRAETKPASRVDFQKLASLVNSSKVAPIPRIIVPRF